MSLVVHCPCGAEVKAETEDEIVDAVGAHVEDKHPDMVGTMSREQVLEMAEEA
jgi:predicted small metal-binding protein